MQLEDYVEAIKLELTSGILELEIDDTIIGKYVKQALREIQRYIDETTLIQVPFASCIDLGPYVDKDGVEHPGFKHATIVNVYRTVAIGDNDNKNGGISSVDPMYAQVWLAYSNGSSMYNLNSYLMNYMTYNTLLQIRNTTSTDLAFKEDKHNNKLYINVSGGQPSSIVIEYIPIFEDVSEIKSHYWIDILQRYSMALVKRGLGRIRNMFKQSSAVYTLDGETLLSEGEEELKELREILRTNQNLFYPVD